MAELPWIPEELHHLALRVARADELCYRVALASHQWSLGQPVDLVRRRENGMEHLVVRAVKPVAPWIGLYFSDAVNQLRVALDNAVFFLAGQLHEGQFTDRQERAVAFPIYEDQGSFGRWQKRMAKDGLPQLAKGALAERIAALQPFNDTSSEHRSIGSWVGEMVGVEGHSAPLLLLLQEYSNTDKHRTLRAAAHNGFRSALAEHWIDDQRSAHALEPGSVVFSTPVGTPVFGEVWPFVAIERPGVGGVPVSPGTELEAMIRYIANTAVPILVTGEAVEAGLPPVLDITDPEKTMAQRIAEAGYETVRQRMQPHLAAGIAAADARPYQLPPLVD